MRRRSVVALVALTALPGACADKSDHDLVSREREYADVYATGLTDERGLQLSQDDADCIAAAVLRELGSEAFEDAGLEPEDLDRRQRPAELLGDGVVTEQQVGAIADAWADCGGLETALAAAFLRAVDLPPEATACVADAMRVAGTREAYAAAVLAHADAAPLDTVTRSVLAMAVDCGGGEGFLVEQLAASFSSDGALDGEQATCVAAGVIESLGAARFLDVTSGTVHIDAVPAEDQAEMTRAVLDATVACGIPLDQLSGP